MALTHNWLNDGGLYLLLPERLVLSWQGTDNDDYDRYCVASDYWLSQLPVGDGFGIALGGDSGMALVVPQSDGTTTLIRWHFAESEVELIALALGNESVKRTEPSAGSSS